MLKSLKPSKTVKAEESKAGVPARFFSQSAILPYRWKDGKLEILLITNHTGKHYVIPKGVIEPGMTAVDSAAKEAFEEAGILGIPEGKPLGQYTYKKWGGRCRVQLYAMEVQQVLAHWPEEEQRSRKWLSTKKAVSLLKHKNLRPLVNRWSKAAVSQRGKKHNPSPSGK